MPIGRIHGLGQVALPLSVVQINGDTRLVVSPAAAIGTDVLLMGTSTALFFASRNVPLRILSFLGASWGFTAAIVEVSKLISGPEARYKELYEV